MSEQGTMLKLGHRHARASVRIGPEQRSGREVAALPQVRARNADHTRIHAELGWEPSIPLREGLEKTYRWIYDELAAGRTDSIFTRDFVKAA